MIIRKGMRADECDFLRLTLIGTSFIDGVRLEMNENGDLILLNLLRGVTKEELDNFENRSIVFHIAKIDGMLPVILLSGAMEVELNFNPALYKDDRFQKFLMKKDLVVPCVMIDTKSKKIVALREMIINVNIKEGFDVTWNSINALHLPQNQFIRLFSRLYQYSLTQLLNLSVIFGRDMHSRSHKELEIPDDFLSEEIKKRYEKIFMEG